jgi:arabinan endo-1,5-alpha-L-arabinosidase
MVHIRRRMERSWRVVGAEDWFFYHAWNATASGTHDGSRGRFGLLDRIEWESGWPHLGDGTPTDGTQRWPGAE